MNNEKTMKYQESALIKALEESFQMYKLFGARSTEKLKPLHRFVAETIMSIFGRGFECHYIGDSSKEMTVVGKYYPKDIRPKIKFAA